MPAKVSPVDPVIAHMPALVRQLREAAGLSKRHVEKAVGLPRGWLGRFESGERSDRVSADFVLRLSRALNVPVSLLFSQPPWQLDLSALVELARIFPPTLGHRPEQSHRGARALLPAGQDGGTGKDTSTSHVEPGSPSPADPDKNS